MKRILTAVLTLSLGMNAFCQTAQTTFLLENYHYNYRFNPAFAPRLNFVGIGLDNITTSGQSNVGLSNFVFPTENGLVTGLNSSIPAEEFLGGLKESNMFETSISENLLSAGFKGRHGGYSTIEVNICANGGMALPYELFDLLKSAGKESYDLSGINIQAGSWAEIAYGYSRKIGETVSVGARVKALIGLARFDTDIRQLDLSINSSKVTVATDASLKLACPYVDVATTQSQYDQSSNDVVDWDAVSLAASNIRPAGYGGAVDLGVSWQPIDGLEASLAVNNLGGIYWKYSTVAMSKGEASFDGVYINTDDESYSIEDELNEALKGFEALTEFHKGEGTYKAFKALPISINAAVRYHMPFYKRLSAGLMSNYTFQNGIIGNSYSFRAGAAVTPLNWISLTGNIGISNFGPVWGAAMSIGHKAVQVYFAVDGYMGRISPYPVDKFNYCTSCGLTIPF